MKMYKWVVEIEIADSWVADGLDLTDARMHDILCRALPWARSNEVRARVLTRPSEGDVNEEQGYPRDKRRDGWPR